MQNRYMLIAGDGEDGAMLWMASMLLLFHRKSPTDSGGTEYLFLVKQ